MQKILSHLSIYFPRNSFLEKHFICKTYEYASLAYRLQSRKVKGGNVRCSLYERDEARFSKITCPVLYPQSWKIVYRRRLISLLPHPPSPLNIARQANHRKTEKERQLADSGEGCRGRSKTYDNEKSWSSINHSILSASTLFDYLSACAADSAYIHKKLLTDKNKSSEVRLVRHCNDEHFVITTAFPLRVITRITIQ